MAVQDRTLAPYWPLIGLKLATVGLPSGMRRQPTPAPCTLSAPRRTLTSKASTTWRSPTALACTLPRRCTGQGLPKRRRNTPRRRERTQGSCTRAQASVRKGSSGPGLPASLPDRFSQKLGRALQRRASGLYGLQHVNRKTCRPVAVFSLHFCEAVLAEQAGKAQKHMPAQLPGTCARHQDMHKF